MVNVSISRRYARALLDVSEPASRSDLVAEQLTAFAQLFEQNRELANLMHNPAYSRDQRSSVVNALMEHAGALDPMLVNTLRLLTDRNRLGYLTDIARLYRDFADEKAGRVRGTVTSAVPLAPDALERLTQNLRTLTRRNIVLESRVDQGVIGGASAQVGGTLYDGTLRTQLEDLRRQLKQH